MCIGDDFVAALSSETLFQAVRRHLGNGYTILTQRGIVALYGAAMLELAKIVDKPVGPFLPIDQVLSDGPKFLRSYGFRGTFGSVLRYVAALYFPPLGRSRNPVNRRVLEQAVRYHYTYELTKPDGVVPARRPVNEMDYALEVPFAFDAQPTREHAIAVVVHCFYPEVLPELLVKLENIPGAVDLFLSTDQDEKKQEIERHVAQWLKGAVEIRVLPNRGRDIGAKFVGFRDIYERYELFLHLHTKKSPHGGTPLERWRDYLIDNILGSPEIVRSILSLFDDEKLGVVFPQHLFEIRGIINWGYNYDKARDLMRKIGVKINKNLVLEFPSGSMFWGRCSAIKPLLDLGLDYSDFPLEDGHVDGTLAHAIERCVLMAVESAGFEWLKVVRRPLYPLQDTVLTVKARSDLAVHRLRVFCPCLTAVDAFVPPYAQHLIEAAPIRTYPSRNARPRLNLILNTVNAHQSFGGVATALKYFNEWSEALGDGFDLRIIVTDAEIEKASYALFPDFTPKPFHPSLDEERRVIVDASGREGGAIDLRAGDFFVATAWWTAHLAIEFDDERKRYFGKSLPFIYLIQDDEPYFYGWGSKFALAEATYHHADRTIAVINSEELFAEMTAKYRFLHAFCIPYRLNERIDKLLASKPRERLILVYGRPSVARNVFEIICAALHAWQQADPIRASRWKIVMLGQSFDLAHVYPLQNVLIEGKLSLERYADYLSRASVGLSLMLSPHPSYPPLEMAAAGLATIGNAFDGKNLAERFPEIVSLAAVTPDCLAEEIEKAAARMEMWIGEIPRRGGSDNPALPIREPTPPDRIARLIEAAGTGVLRA